MNKKVFLITSLYMIAILLFLLFDFHNFLSFITYKLNSEYLNIFIESITAVYLFLIAYYLIDKRISDNEAEKKTNKQNALCVMLYETYDECYKSIDLFKNDVILTKYIVPKVDFNNTIDPFIERQKTYVFKYDDKILDFVSDGVVEKDILREYIDIKQLFSQYINMKITLFDINSSKYNDNENAKEARLELKKLEQEITLKVTKAISLVESRI